MSIISLRHTLAASLFLWVASTPVRADNPGGVSAQDVIWTTPGKNSSDSMPLGNGELGINLWVEENGDLLFYLSRNDSFSEISQLCKTGMIRVSLSPNPFLTGQPFRQELKLRDGICEITAGSPGAEARLKIFVDSAHPVVHVIGESEAPLTVTAVVESWRTEKQKVPPGGTAWTLRDSPQELWQEADVFPEGKPDSVAWYHRNEVSTAFEETVRVQSLETIRSTMRDPLLHNTFGGWLTGSGFKSDGNRKLTTPSPVKSFDLRVSSPCSQTATADEWLALAETTAAQSADPAAALARTIASWNEFWSRSWVNCDAGTIYEIPRDGKPPRIGIDSTGASKFAGKIGGVKVTGQLLTAGEIATRATAAQTTEPTTDLTMPVLKNGITLEAWIQPPANESGRIIDKISVGGADGFLLDCQPGNRLRMIVGSNTLQSPEETLKPGEWQHVAATYDNKSGAMEIFLSGKSVAQNTPTPNPMTVGKAHTLQRYMQACAGRGLYPIKFNGSIFTVEPTPSGNGENPDWRRWGDCHWWQNVRMPYHAMQATGDFDLMMPLFNMFESIRPFAEARAKLYHNVEGCYFAETMTVWGTYANGDYGWNRTGLQPKDVQSPWWQFVWNQGLELVSLMLDYHDYTGDEAFLKTRLLPMATSILRYFDTRFRKDAEGKIVLDPTQSVETYWVGVINDTPSVAGLNDITNRLCALPENSVTPEQRAFFQHMKAAAPVIPIEDATLDGKTVRRIGVAQKYNPQRTNIENPELFPIWPFRIFGLERPMLEEARNAYQMRGSHNDVGWGYDSNAAALLGMRDEAARILNVKIANSHPAYRWPATWGPNFDWLPDQCHGGNLMATTNYMLLQHSGDKILLLPAWPHDWDVSFKLHAPRNTTVECFYSNGKIEKLEVSPPERRKDIVLPSFPVTVRNNGVGGQNTTEAIATDLAPVLATKPDHLVISYGLNDALWAIKLVPLETYRANLTNMVKQAKDARVKTVFLLGIHPCNMVYVALTSPSHPQIPRLQDHLAQYNAVVAEVAAATGATFIDWRARFLENSPGKTIDEAVSNHINSLLYCEANTGIADGVHLTIPANKLLGTLVAEALRPVVASGDTIACLGDSVTFGAYMTGGGTATGDTYPAVVSKTLNP